MVLDPPPPSVIKVSTFVLDSFDPLPPPLINNDIFHSTLKVILQWFLYSAFRVFSVLNQYFFFTSGFRRTQVDFDRKCLPSIECKRRKSFFENFSHFL